MGLPVVFKHTVFTLEPAFGGGEVTRDEIVHFDFVGLPGGHGWRAMVAETVIVFFLGAQAEPFGLGSFQDEGVEERVFGWVLVAVEPAVEELEEVGFVFVVEDERGGAHAVTGGVAGGRGTSCICGRTRSAGVTFLVFRMIEVRMIEFRMIRGGIPILLVRLGGGAVGEILLVRKHGVPDLIVC